MELYRSKIEAVDAAKPNTARIQEGKQAIERLLRVAESDTGQSRRCANFLLAWWNATDWGGFDLTDMWAIDLELAQDMVTVFALVSNFQRYPDSDVFGYGPRFERIVERWRERVPGFNQPREK